MTILETYGKLNFTPEQREKLSIIDKRIIKLNRIIEQKNNIIKKYEDEKSELQKEIHLGWSMAYKMQKKLQEKCKHNGPSRLHRISRDFGDDLLITECSLCDSRIDKIRVNP